MKLLSIILAISENNVIGKSDIKTPLPWRLPRDTKFFKDTTIGNGNNVVVMGGRTWETIPEKYRPLSGRTNIVLSRTITEIHPDVTVFSDLEELLKHLETLQVDKVFIAGGLQIYKLFLPYVKEIFLTRVHAAPKGDVIWKDLDLTGWKRISQSFHPKDENNAYAMTFFHYERG